MWAKVLLAALCGLMIACAIHFKPVRERALLATRRTDGPRLRLMTWNIGYAELESDTRAQTKDLRAVAETILEHEPDAVAIQELINDAQLRILLSYLGGRYTGRVAQTGNADRVEAVLVKDNKATFADVPGDGNFALAATFHVGQQKLTFISAHADAFSAARRRVFTGAIVDWARTRSNDEIVFIAGDFNFEVSAADNTHLYTDNLKHDSESYSYLLKYFRDLGRDAGDTAINDRRIDYIFGPQEERVLLRRAEVLRGAAVGRMDHWPVIVEVAL